MLIFFVFLLLVIDVYSAGWHYGEGESTWPDNCRRGLRQSPINIDTNDVILDNTFVNGPLDFKGYENLNFFVINDGHTVKFRPDPRVSATLVGGPLKYIYDLKNIHFHWMSEHSVDGFKFPLEVHFVHHRHDLDEVEALSHPDGYCVVAIHITVTVEGFSSKSLHPVINAILKVSNISSITEEENINFNAFFDEINPNKYFSYNGSLTTPDCDEAVFWIIMKDTLKISDRQHTSLRSIVQRDLMNYRGIQPLNGRKVLSSSSSRTTTRYRLIVTFLAFCFLSDSNV